LWLGTKGDNATDRDIKGRHWVPSGENHYNAKLTDGQIKTIRSDPRIQCVIAAEFGIAQSTVSRIKCGKRRRAAS
ncbi:hypothetical protein LCGC14_1794570, partial [marine sediment metagenome]